MIDKIKLLLNYKKYIKLDIALTNLCNSRCQTCNIWQYYQHHPKKLINEITASKYQEFFKNNRDINQITFSGGEPFLKKDFLKIVESAVSLIPKLDYINIVTNCIQSKFVIKQLGQIIRNGKIKKLHLAMSLDGDEKTHDRIRGIKGNYRRVMEVARYIKSLNDPRISYHFSYTISKHNLGNIANLFKSNEVTANEIALCFAQSSVRYNQHKDKDSFTAETGLIKLEVRSFLKFYHVNNLENLVQWLFLQYFLKDKKIVCVSGQNTFHLDPYGNFYQCGIRDGVIGNIKDGIRKRIPPKNCSCYTPCESYFGIINEGPLAIIKALF